VEEQYVIRYQKPGDIERAKRGTDGAKRVFTVSEARWWLKRCRAQYPNARIVRYAPKREPDRRSRVEVTRARMLEAR
jgi:hypothetical protein